MRAAIARRAASIALVAALAVAGATAAGAGEIAGTFSIVALDSATGEIGVAVQSRAFSVGSAVAWVEAGVGAIATQSQTNESFGPLGLALLREGLSAADAMRALLAGDPGRELRQVGIVDARGGAAAFTGSKCSDWAGDSTLTAVSVQGNILAGPAVVADMVQAFRSTPGELADRLLAALEAGQAAGGDKRGQQSAALIVGRPSEKWPEYRTRYIDLRVEDHKTPIEELARLYRIAQTSDLLEAHLRYAALYDSLGRSDDAARERDRVGWTLRRALDSGLRDAQALNALAWYCATQDFFLQESLEAARLATDIEPRDSAILDTLAEVYFRMGRTQDAIATAERALAIAPEDPYLRGQLERFRAGVQR